jgi:Skp family chaperone for outer membrane proteins
MLRAILFSLVTLFLFTLTASAQTAPPVPFKFGVTNSNAFVDEKTGITRLVNGVKALNAEFAVVQNDLESMAKKIDTLGKEIETMRTQSASGVPVDEKAFQAKNDELERLQRDGKYKQEDAKRNFEKRYAILINPIMNDIAKGLNDFAKQNHYTVIIDLAKDDVGLIVAIGDDKVDVTKDFITFYNAKPPVTLAPAK